MNIAELNDLDEATRVEVEGFRIGTYLRLEIHGIPFEMVEYFDPRHPILVGGVALGEENVGYMQVLACLQCLYDSMWLFYLWASELVISAELLCSSEKLITL